MFQFVSSLFEDMEFNEDYTDNDKMDRNESILKYIGGSSEQESMKEQRFSNMYTQDAYYELPRKLYF